MTHCETVLDALNSRYRSQVNNSTSTERGSGPHAICSVRVDDPSYQRRVDFIANNIIRVDMLPGAVGDISEFKRVLRELLEIPVILEAFESHPQLSDPNFEILINFGGDLGGASVERTLDGFTVNIPTRSQFHFVEVDPDSPSGFSTRQMSLQETLIHELGHILANRSPEGLNRDPRNLNNGFQYETYLINQYLETHGLESSSDIPESDRQRINRQAQSIGEFGATAFSNYILKRYYGVDYRASYAVVQSYIGENGEEIVFSDRSNLSFLRGSDLFDADSVLFLNDAIRLILGVPEGGYGRPPTAEESQSLSNLLESLVYDVPVLEMLDEQDRPSGVDFQNVLAVLRSEVVGPRLTFASDSAIGVMLADGISPEEAALGFFLLGDIYSFGGALSSGSNHLHLDDILSESLSDLANGVFFGEEAEEIFVEPTFSESEFFNLLNDVLGSSTSNTSVGQTSSSNEGSAIFGQIAAEYSLSDGIYEFGDALNRVVGAVDTTIGIIDDLAAFFERDSETGVTSGLLTNISGELGQVSSFLAGAAYVVQAVGGVASDVEAISHGEYLNVVLDRGLNTAVTRLENHLLSQLSGPERIAAQLGQQLGNLIVSPRTRAAQALSTLGSAGGAYLGAAIGNAILPGVGGYIGSFIGSTIGSVLGSLIGNLFGSKKPKTPSAAANVNLNFLDSGLTTTSVTSQNSGDEAFVSRIAQTTLTAVNAYTSAVLSGGGELLSSPNLGVEIGHTGNDVYVEINGQRTVVENSAEAITIVASEALSSLEISGGSLMMKRALNGVSEDSIAGLSSSLAIANDYETYLRHQELIDSALSSSYDQLSQTDKDFYNENKALFDAIQFRDVEPLTAAERNWFAELASPNSSAGQRHTRITSILNQINSVSSFAAGWIISLRRAAELGLGQSAASDFYGGAKGFVDSLQGIVSAPLDYEDVTFYLRGNDLEVYRDDDGSGAANAAHDTLVFDETNFLSPIGTDGGGVGYNRATSNATMTFGNDIITNAAGTIDDRTSQTITTTTDPTYVPELGITIPGQTITTTQTIDGGDDIIIGNSGSNTFYGRSGDDWLDGGAGNARDNLYGGNDGDVLLGRGGNDWLYGEDGDDVLIGGDGLDRLYGGNGNDTLIDGGGNNVVVGQGGDDLLIVEQGATTGLAGQFRGGSGSKDGGNDTLSFERYREGISLDMSFRPASWDTHSHAFYRHEDTRFYDVRRNDGSNSRINYLYVAQIDNVSGTQFGDTLTGDANDNILRGLGGNDVLNGGGGHDVLEGGAGADTINAAGSWRTTDGMTTLSYAGSSSGVDVSTQYVASLGGGHAFGGDASGDVINGFVDHIIGSEHADILEGTHGHGDIWGMGGDDYLIVTRANDNLYGGEGFDTADFGNHNGSTGLAINAYDGGGTYGYRNIAGHSHNYTTRLHEIEHVVGTNGADTIRFGAGDNVLEGGGGNDTLYGGDGNDIYFVEIGGGNDSIYEYGNQGHDTIMVGYEDGLTWDDVFIGAGANLSVLVNNQTLATAFNSPNDNRELVGVDAIDIGGVGAVDIWYVNYGASRRLASGTGELIYGDHQNGSARRNLLQGTNGNDSIYAAGSASSHETENNFLQGGRGNDRIYASVGDDQYIFDRGSGRDTVTDTGGLDHIQFGPGVQLEELVFTVVGNDLYIGIAPEGADTSDLNANQMSDYIRIFGGGVKAITHSGSAHRNLLEYITVQNVNIDVRTLDLDWTYVDETVPTTPGGGGGPFNGPIPNIPPIMFDLDGDGLELISVNESRIVVRGNDRSLTRVGWLGADDGFLALDRNGDGKINSLSEVSFAQDLEGAETDLEGLAAYDTNADGVFDASDERFGEFRIWQDRNQNGRGGRRELMTLAEAGISYISLEGVSTGNNINDYADNVILNTTEVGLADGTISTGYDVALASTVIRAGRESATSTIGQSDDVLDGRLGRISVRRLEALLARQERLAAQALDTSVKPIVIDLNGDGELALEHLSESGVQLDVDGNGEIDRVGWVGAADGFLALDRNGNGLIEAFDEISFVQDLEGALTDLEGLKAFDTNEDGVFDGGDTRFSEFVIWQDLNQDGLSDASEIRSLEDWGITSISLEPHTEQTSFGGELENELFGLTAVGYADGSEGLAGDVGLRVEYAGLTDSITREDAFITGFAGLEHVHIDSAAVMSSITLDTDWGQIAGGRSPLMAMLYAAEVEQARLDALGTDTGLTQDELLADFDADDEDEAESDEAEADGEEASSEGNAIDDDASDDDGDSTGEFETPVPDDFIDHPAAPYMKNVASLLDGLDPQTLASATRSMLAHQALPDPEPLSALPNNMMRADLDRFTQAMAGFGAQSAFAGLQVGDKEEGRFNDIIGTQTRSSLMTQLS